MQTLWRHPNQATRNPTRKMLAQRLTASKQLAGLLTALYYRGLWLVFFMGTGSAIGV